jgi:chemotaxis regulatin CheY-phosphate phosphatase CheZ
MEQQLLREGESVGVERSVTRWYALRQMFQQEIDALQSQLEQSQPEGQADQERSEIEQHLADARARLQALGLCPKPMMG